MDLLISFIPVVVMIVAIVGFKMRGDIAGCIGWVLTVIIAFAIFNTSLEVSLLATLKGALASMAITGMGFFALLQITFMQETGALARAIVAIKTLAASDKPTQIMLLNVVMGTGLVSVGATPAIILPPIMLGLGYSIGMSIALPCIGYDSLCTFAMLAAPVVALSDILAGAGFTVNGAAPTVAYCAQYFTNYLPVITPCIAFSMLFMCGGAKLLKQGIIPALITGFGMGGTAWVISRIGFGVVLTGVMSAAVTFCIMFVYMKIRKIPLVDRSCLSEEDLEVEKTMPLWKALSPWALLIFFCVITNFVGPLYDLLYKGPLEMRIILWPGDSGQPMRVFWQAYFWVLVSTLLGSLIIKPKAGAWGTILKKWNKRWLPPTLSSIVYFCIAYVMMFSAYAPDPANGGAWAMVDPSKNIISLWANSAAAAFGWFYPIANGFLGLLAGFVTGSEASTVALFAKYNLISAELLGLNPIVVIASGGVAAGLASVVTPVKLQQAAASLDAVGEEGAVLRTVLPYAVVLVTVSVILSQIFAVTITV